MGVRISMPASEAALLLLGLEEQREELGPLAEELIALLRGKGISPPVQDHVRVEYMGPD